MASLNFEHTQSQHAQQKFALMARLEQANVLEMSEGEFHRLVAEIEKSPLFKKLYREEKVIRYQRFPRTDIASNFLELREETVADEGSLDIESLLINKKHIVHLIQKIGLEKFKQYFLFNEPDVDVSYIARECDLEISEIQQINSLINEFSVLSEFYNPSASRPEQVMLYSKIASIEKRQDSFIIGYFSPSFARGKYSIDYEKFEELKKNEAFSDVDLNEVQRIIKKLELPPGKSHRLKKQQNKSCFWCAWNRRKMIFQTAAETGCNKVALGHNMDDIVQTMLLNLFFNSEISAMSPKQELFKGKLTIIRPLAYVPENRIARFVQVKGMPLAKNTCSNSFTSNRKKIAQLIKDLEKTCPHIKTNIFRSIRRIKQDYLL